MNGGDETVSAENAEKGSGKGRRHLGSHFLRPVGNGGHGIDDPEHGGDDADAGQGVSHEIENFQRAVPLVLHRLDFGVEQRFEAVRLDFAVDHRPEGIDHEGHALWVGGEGRIFFKDGAVLGVGDVVVEGDEAVPAAGHEHFVEQLEEIDNLFPLQPLGSKGINHGADDLLDDHVWAGDQKDTEGNTTDDDELGKMKQHHGVAAREHKAPEGGCDDDNISQDEDHGVSYSGRAAG